ncbi:hypothetical protein D3C72_2484100 [compost metagenome]
MPLLEKGLKLDDFPVDRNRFKSSSASGVELGQFCPMMQQDGPQPLPFAFGPHIIVGPEIITGV